MREVMLEARSIPTEWVDPSIAPSPWIGVLFDIGKSCAVESRKKRPPMQTILDSLEYLYKHPSSAVALQIMYDERNKMMKQQQQQQQQQKQQQQPQQTRAGSGSIHSPEPLTIATGSSHLIPAVLESDYLRSSNGPLSSRTPTAGAGATTTNGSSSSVSTLSSVHKSSSHSFSADGVDHHTESTLEEDEESRLLISKVLEMDRSLIEPLHKYLPNISADYSTTSSYSVPDISMLQMGKPSSNNNNLSAEMIPAILEENKISSSNSNHNNMSGIPDLSLMNLSSSHQKNDNKPVSAAGAGLPKPNPPTPVTARVEERRMMVTSTTSDPAQDRLRQIEAAAETAAMFDPLA